jgi:hypothetical protein
MVPCPPADLFMVLMRYGPALALGKQSASAPFKAIGQNHVEWADAQYWPTQIQVTDPSRMNGPEIESLLSFWRQRQETFPPSEIFRWSHVQVGGKKAPEKVMALYPNVQAQEAIEDDCNEELGPAGSRKAGKNKKKGKGKQKQKKSPETVDDNSADGLGRLNNPPEHLPPDRGGPLTNMESTLQVHHIDPALQPSSSFSPGPMHGFSPSTQFGPIDQVHPLTGMLDFGPSEDMFLPPISGPNDHLYSPVVFNNGNSNCYPGELIQPYKSPGAGGLLEVWNLLLLSTLCSSRCQYNRKETLRPIPFSH